MSPKLICLLNWNVTETEMSPKLKYSKLKCHENLNVTKTQVSPKLKNHLKWNITKTKMSLKLKCHHNDHIWDVYKWICQLKNQDIGTDCFGLVSWHLRIVPPLPKKYATCNVSYVKDIQNYRLKKPNLVKSKKKN